MSKLKTFRDYGHAFHFKIAGREKPLTFHVKVRNSRKPVDLRLTANDVRQSIALKGIGNTQTCSMAVCAKRQAEAFPHAVEGFIDWSYSRAYVVNKVRVDGTPAECVVYRHYDDIAHLNDAKDGQKTLLADLTANGDRVIRLLAMDAKKPNRSHKATGAGKKRKRRVINLKGANLRFAVAQLGGVAA